LRLLGGRFGVDTKEYPGGLLAPVDNWMMFLPELGYKYEISKTRPVTLKHGTVNLATDPETLTDEQFERSRQDRFEVRNFVRKILQADKVKAKPVDAPAPVATRARGALTLENSALAALAGGASNPNELGKPLFEFVANVTSVEVDESSPGTPSPPVVVWLCGKESCKKENRTGPGVIECKKCSGRNFVNAMPMCLDIDGGHSESEESEEGSVWSNEGKEFVNERDVSKYMPRFKGTVLALLGVHKLREMLRVVQVKNWVRGDVILEERTPVISLVILHAGEIHLTLGEQERRIVREKIIVADDPDKGSTNAEVVDISSYVGNEKSLQINSAIVHSQKAVTFSFGLQDVIAYCGYESLGEVVAGALSMSMVQGLGFKKGLIELEQQWLASSLVYKEYQVKDTIIEKGRPGRFILFVQKGRLKMVDGKKTKVFVVSKDKVSCGSANETWHKALMIGMRSMLYDVGCAYTIEAIDGCVKCWLLMLTECDNVAPTVDDLSSTTMRTLLQMSMFIEHLRSTIVFKKIPNGDTRLRKMVAGMLPRDCWEEEDIIVQGGRGHSMFILFEGAVKIYINDVEIAFLTSDSDFHKVHMFGEFSLLDGSPRQATVRVKSTTAVVLEIREDDIVEHFESIEKLLAEQGLTVEEVIKEQREKVINKGANTEDKHGQVEVSGSLKKKGEVKGNGADKNGKNGPKDSAKAKQEAYEAEKKYQEERKMKQMNFARAERETVDREERERRGGDERKECTDLKKKLDDQTAKFKKPTADRQKW